LDNHIHFTKALQKFLTPTNAELLLNTQLPIDLLYELGSKFA
jgi:hypothetical protein